MRSVMRHYAQQPQVNAPRSSFDRSHGHKTTFDAGYIIPVYLDEALPGDTFNLRASFFARLATPIYPIMDNVVLECAFFAVPYRLVWTNFVKMMGEQTDPGDTTEYVVPTMTSTAVTGYALNSLHDYMGLPTEVPDMVHSSLWHRAYQLIYNQWFRDQNLQDSIVVDTDDGPDTPSDYFLRKPNKRHDYFTSCLPWPQKSEDGAVEIPHTPTGNATVLRTNSADRWRIFTEDTNTLNTAVANLGNDANSAPSVIGSAYISFDPNGGLYAGLADSSVSNLATINQLREAVMLQNLYELDARGGTRYTEIVRAHFNVISDDARLQRSEYLGGGIYPVNIHPVPQQSPTSGSNAMGDLAGYGTVSGNGAGFTKSFTEHCLILGLVYARQDITYQQGLDRMFSRSTRYDFYWPALAHLGEQAVLNKEIYCQGSGGTGPANDNLAFGYQERWAEYRYKHSTVTGLFRSNATGTLDAWHLSPNFSELPTLGAIWIQEESYLDRAIAVPTEPHFLFDSYFSLKCARPMPTFSIPGFGTRF